MTWLDEANAELEKTGAPARWGGREEDGYLALFQPVSSETVRTVRSVLEAIDVQVAYLAGFRDGRAKWLE